MGFPWACIVIAKRLAKRAMRFDLARLAMWLLLFLAFFHADLAIFDSFPGFSGNKMVVRGGVHDFQLDVDALIRSSQMMRFLAVPKCLASFEKLLSR